MHILGSPILVIFECENEIEKASKMFYRETEMQRRFRWIKFHLRKIKMFVLSGESFTWVIDNLQFHLKICWNTQCELIYYLAINILINNFSLLLETERTCLYSYHPQFVKIVKDISNLIESSMDSLQSEWIKQVI